MNRLSRLMLCSLACLLVVGGCSYQRNVNLSRRIRMPEEVYASHRLSPYAASNVAVFNLKEPSYAGGMGRRASEALYRALLRNGVFANVTPEWGVEDLRIENLIEVARARNYDVIITGELLYCFEGSLQQASRVDELIRVFRVSADETKTLWYAKAVEVADPAPLSDYFIWVGRGAPAPSATELMMRNADKFCKMFLNPL